MAKFKALYLPKGTVRQAIRELREAKTGNIDLDVVLIPNGNDWNLVMTREFYNTPSDDFPEFADVWETRFVEDFAVVSAMGERANDSQGMTEEQMLQALGLAE